MTSPRVQALMRVLEEEPGLTVGELAERTGYATRQLHMLLWRLQADGAVVNEGRRWYVASAARRRA